MHVYGHILSLQYYTTSLSLEKWEDYFRVNPGIFARYLRIHPTDWSGGPCLRVDVFSCPSKNIQPSFFVQNIFKILIQLSYNFMPVQILTLSLQRVLRQVNPITCWNLSMEILIKAPELQTAS